MTTSSIRSSPEPQKAIQAEVKALLIPTAAGVRPAQARALPWTRQRASICFRASPFGNPTKVDGVWGLWPQRDRAAKQIDGQSPAASSPAGQIPTPLVSEVIAEGPKGRSGVSRCSSVAGGIHGVLMSTQTMREEAFSEVGCAEPAMT